MVTEADTYQECLIVDGELEIVVELWIYHLLYKTLCIFFRIILYYIDDIGSPLTLSIYTKLSSTYSTYALQFSTRVD